MRYIFKQIKFYDKKDLYKASAQVLNESHQIRQFGLIISEAVKIPSVKVTGAGKITSGVV